MMEASQAGDGVDRGALCEESRSREKEADGHAASSILRITNIRQMGVADPGVIGCASEALSEIFG
jgi:hypothetical protein